MLPSFARKAAKLPEAVSPRYRPVAAGHPVRWACEGCLRRLFAGHAYRRRAWLASSPMRGSGSRKIKGAFGVAVICAITFASITGCGGNSGDARFTADDLSDFSASFEQAALSHAEDQNLEANRVAENIGQVPYPERATVGSVGSHSADCDDGDLQDHGSTKCTFEFVIESTGKYSSAYDSQTTYELQYEVTMDPGDRCWHAEADLLKTSNVGKQKLRGDERDPLSGCLSDAASPSPAPTEPTPSNTATKTETGTGSGSVAAVPSNAGGAFEIRPGQTCPKGWTKLEGTDPETGEETPGCGIPGD